MSPQNAPLTSALNLLGLPAAAAELEVNIAPLLQRHNIDISLLESHDGFIAANSLFELLEDAAKTFNCPHFGLLVAKHKPSLSLGVLTQLGLHSKSLQRALQAENTSFKDLLNETRMQVATFYLSNSGIELIRLADILGYSDPSAFSRSFKKQYGVSPQNWRRQHV